MKHQTYSSDAPLYDPSLDQFNRFPFAQRVASVISKRNDPSSIVIGIYGSWGEGKTSVFNFIERELKNEDDVVCLKFNPWRFGDEEQMLINFFNDLATVIDGSIETGREKLGDIIGKFGKPLASAFGQGETVDEVASFFSRADIEELRRRIENLLENEKKRVVILIDDIDRLEKNEIHAVFRLVKLTADFKYTAYILAFDKEVVSVALQERYGSTDSLGIGNSFLEKIIQVPLHLPTVEKEDLRNFCFKELDQVLNFSGIELSEEDIRNFGINFSQGLELHLKTPRQAKLYTNILMFSLPILKDEANVVDLMLIEGIRVFLPDIYYLIRDHKDLFLGNTESGYGYDYDKKELTRRKERIEEVLEELSIEQKKNMEDLLCFLFPKLNKIYKNVQYGSDWEVKWGEKQRICSPQYFQRYFTYAINKRDISDIALNGLIELSELQSIDYVVSKINNIITDKNAEIFITKLRRFSKNFTPIQSKVLAISIARIGNKLPNPIQLFRSFNPYGQGALFISDCIENLKIKQEQFDLAEKVVFYASSLNFAVECYSWFRKDTEERPNPQGFSEQDYARLGEKLAERISKELSNIDEVELEKYDRLPFIIYIWNKFGVSKEAVSTISRIIQGDPASVFVFLNSYTGISFGDFGSKRSSFSKENYNSIKEIINPGIIAGAILKVFNDIQLNDSYLEYSDLPRDEELAHQFLWLYRKNEE